MLNLYVDHAHPTLVAGHPFKGSWVSSSGFLLHPEMKRFQINTPILFAPPNPLKVVGAASTQSSVPTFANFFSSYFGGASYNLKSQNAGKMLEGMKRCYENNSVNPLQSCSYYIDGFKRMAVQA